VLPVLPPARKSATTRESVTRPSSRVMDRSAPSKAARMAQGLDLEHLRVPGHG
jgi:hypothetical protein